MKPQTRYGRDEHEVLDPTPLEMPIGYGRPTPIHDLIASMVRQELANEKNEEFETIEENDDFEEEDPALLDLSPYTLRELADEIPLGDWNLPIEEEPSQTKADTTTGDPPDPNVAETE